MLEVGPALRTWALAEEPAIGKRVRAEPLPDHRLAYLDYEGEISGGRGSVRRVEWGEFRVLRQGEDELVFEMRGEWLKCICTARKGDHAWLVHFTKLPTRGETERTL